MCMFPVLLALHVWSRDACQFPVSFENQTALHLLPRFPPYFIYVYLYSENFSRSASVLNLVIALCFIFGRDLDWNEKKKKERNPRSCESPASFTLHGAELVTSCRWDHPNSSATNTNCPPSNEQTTEYDGSTWKPESTWKSIDNTHCPHHLIYKHAEQLSIYWYE